MEKKIQIIKKILQPKLEQEGFHYSGNNKSNWRFEGGKGECWLFERQDDEWIQLIVVSDSCIEKMVWVEIDEIKQGENPWEAYGYGVAGFKGKEATLDEGKIKYKDMETFKDALMKIAALLHQYFLPGFVQLRQPRYKYCVTEGMREKVYQRREELVKALAKEYGMKELEEDNFIKFIRDVVEGYKDKGMEEFEEVFLGLSAYLGELLVNKRTDCQWEWDDLHKFCGIRTETDGGKWINPLEIIFDEWTGNHMAAENCYDREIVRWRKKRKSSRQWELESSKKDKGFREGKYVDTKLVDFMKTYNFKDDFWNGKGRGVYRGWKFNREVDGKMHELWFIRGRGTDELWVKGITGDGKSITVRDSREGLGPYDSNGYCRLDDSACFPQIMRKLMEQAEREFLPVLENEKEYLPEYDLPPEMERSQFLDRKELLEQLAVEYGTEGLGKEAIPEFVKKVLKENEGKTMEEFGATLLGLGILLGETAIKEGDDRHWLWDQTHAACVVTSGDEVFGIDPAFALNYAWQKKKPENVDRLCKDLFGDWEWLRGSGE